MALQKIKCATRADVAREANVSETIVSYVMNNNRYVAAEKRKRVLEAAEKLNYSPNNMALALSGKDSKQLLFIVDTPESERLGSMLGSLDKYAYEKGSVVTLCACRNDESFVSRILSERFDRNCYQFKEDSGKICKKICTGGNTDCIAADTQLQDKDRCRKDRNRTSKRSRGLCKIFL